MARWRLPADLLLWISHLSQSLHARLAWRLPRLLTGMLFAQGRRTVASWLRAAQLGDDYRAYYYFLGSLGRKVKWVATVLLRQAVTVVEPGGRLLFGLDDTPTKRYGPLVEGAGITTRLPVRRSRSSSTAISGSRWPGSYAIPGGVPLACRCAPCSTCGRNRSLC